MTTAMMRHRSRNWTLAMISSVRCLDRIPCRMAGRGGDGVATPELRAITEKLAREFVGDQRLSDADDRGVLVVGQNHHRHPGLHVPPGQGRRP